MQAGSCWPGIHDPTGQLCMMSMGLGRLGQIYPGHGNLGGFCFVMGTFYGVGILLDEAIGLGYCRLKVVCLNNIFQ